MGILAKKQREVIPEACGAHLGFDKRSDASDFLPRILFEFHDQDRTRIAFDEKSIFALFGVILGAFQYVMVDQFTGSGVVAQCDQIRPQRFINAVEMHA